MFHAIQEFAQTYCTISRLAVQSQGCANSQIAWNRYMLKETWKGLQQTACSLRAHCDAWLDTFTIAPPSPRSTIPFATYCNRDRQEFNCTALGQYDSKIDLHSWNIVSRNQACLCTCDTNNTAFRFTSIILRVKIQYGIGKSNMNQICSCVKIDRYEQLEFQYKAGEKSIHPHKHDKGL